MDYDPFIKRERYIHGERESAREREREREKEREGRCGVNLVCKLDMGLPLGLQIRCGFSQIPANTMRRFAHRSTLPIRKRPPPRTTIEPWSYPYCRILRGGGFLQARYSSSMCTEAFSSPLPSRVHHFALSIALPLPSEEETTPKKN